VRAVARLARGAPGPVLVARKRVELPGVSRLGSFAADGRFARAAQRIETTDGRRPSRAHAPFPDRVLVTDAGRGSATAVIKALGRRGWHVIAADEDTLAPGCFSRHARARVR